jgi:hypothetical protein
MRHFLQIGMFGFALGVAVGRFGHPWTALQWMITIGATVVFLAVSK